ncbi:hypothetical protein KD913_05525 [Klebsiella pneumoniae]
MPNVTVSLLPASIAFEPTVYHFSAADGLPDRQPAEALSREKIDGWLQHLGASDKFDASKGIDWGVMPGPFYTPELGLGIGTAVVGLYRPDPQDTTSQNSTLTLSGYASSTGAFGLSVKNYTFFDRDLWRVFVDGSIANTPTYYWGQGFHAGDKDNEKRSIPPGTDPATHPLSAAYRSCLSRGGMVAGGAECR